MKKMTGLFFATTVLMAMGGTVENAAEASPTELETNAKVTFDKSDEPTNPVDPENPDPEEPVDPGEGGNGGKGDLRIDWAPSFDFGTHTLKNTNGLTLPVKRTATQSVAHFVQVTDNRGVENADWKLDVKASNLASGDNTIEGATISFVGQSAKMIDDNGAVIEVPNGPKWDKQVIDFGTTQTLISASGDGAMGTSSMGMSTKGNVSEDLTDSNINLNIPSESAKKIKKGDYTATLAWELSSTVTAEGTFMAPQTK